MSWFNPEPQEAYDLYCYNKNRYLDAAESRAASVRQERQCVYEKQQAQKTISNCKSEKTNFEKRIKGIDQIIKMLEQEGGLFSVSVPSTISTANKKASQTDTSFKGCIKSDGVTAANMGDVIGVKSVAEELHSSSALTKLKNEKARLEKSVEELNSTISNLNEQISRLTSQIRVCDAEQADLQRVMSSSSYEMSHYRRYM